MAREIPPRARRMAHPYRDPSVVRAPIEDGGVASSADDRTFTVLGALLWSWSLVRITYGFAAHGADSETWLAIFLVMGLPLFLLVGLLRASYVMRRGRARRRPSRDVATRIARHRE